MTNNQEWEEQLEQTKLYQYLQVAGFTQEAKEFISHQIQQAKNEGYEEGHRDALQGRKEVVPSDGVYEHFA